MSGDKECSMGSPTTRYFFISNYLDILYHSISSNNMIIGRTNNIPKAEIYGYKLGVSIQTPMIIFMTHFTLNQGKYLSSNTLEDRLPRNTDWFFDYYVRTNRQIDLKIKKIENDTIVNVKNKSGFDLPYTLTTLKKKDVIEKNTTCS